MKLDFENNRIIIEDKEIHLTKMENKILQILYRNKNELVKNDEIIKEIYHVTPDKGLRVTLRKHVSLLKQKIGDYIKIRTEYNLGYMLEENIKKKIEADFKYIKDDIVAKREDGNYCRFSRIINAVANESITYRRYIEYWQKRYKEYPEKVPEFIEVCKQKLENGLTDKEVFINLVRKSNEREEDKKKIIKSLGGKY